LESARLHRIADRVAYGVGLLLVIAGTLPDWSDDYYFRIKRVRRFEIGLIDPMLGSREWLVPNRTARGWTRIGSTFYFDPICGSGACMLGGILLLGLRRTAYFQRNTSNTVRSSGPTSS